MSAAKEMSPEKSLVTTAESIQIKGKRVGETIVEMLSLLKDDFPATAFIFLASSYGLRIHGPRETDHYTFCCNDHGMPDHRQSWFKVMLRWLTQPWHRARMIGSISLNNRTNGSSHNNWVIEVFGKEYFKLFEELATLLSEKFKVKIHVRLESEEPKQVDPDPFSD